MTNQERLTQTILELMKEKERLRTDAKRYRWLRQHTQFLGLTPDYHPNEVDKHVDEAVANS